VIRLLHLSDIHFRRSDGAELLDVDAAVRTDLLNDVRDLATEVAQVDAIVVVGDIAATGAPAEYARASAFLDEAASIVGCERSDVVCVPGNHDVDRGRQAPLHDGLRRLLRTAEPRLAGATLGEVLGDGEAAAVLHEPFAGYNDFALPLGCRVTALEPVWAPKELDLDGTVLRIRGVNTALTCDGTESDLRLEDRLVLGDVQLAQLAQDHRIVTVLLAHHPPGWLRDAEAVDPWLARPHLLLTGHVHALGIVPRPDGRGVAISSGAVTPDRTEVGWAPAYNVIALAVEDDALRVDVWVRCYGADRAGFGPDPRFASPHRMRFPLGRGSGEMPQVARAVAPGPPEALHTERRAQAFARLSAAL
jgi:predicted MPP superfamily phosphohydrolase